mmetsp:Transcript_14044/g.44113  ORF Transcript_14044/g.44113 Transcript_14044/m.44113 type:complete len:255 (+) Transcript_14044:2484-3248(+)
MTLPFLTMYSVLRLASVKPLNVTDFWQAVPLSSLAWPSAPMCTRFWWSTASWKTQRTSDGPCRTLAAKRSRAFARSRSSSRHVGTPSAAVVVAVVVVGGCSPQSVEVQKRSPFMLQPVLQDLLLEQVSSPLTSSRVQRCSASAADAAAQRAVASAKVLALQASQVPVQPYSCICTLPAPSLQHRTASSSESVIAVQASRLLPRCSGLPLMLLASPQGVEVQKRRLFMAQPVLQDWLPVQVPSPLASARLQRCSP